MKYQILAATAVLAFSSAVSAQVYGVVSTGVSKQNLDCTGATTCDTSGTAFKLLGGYKITPQIAAELGFFDFGKAKAADSTASLETKTSAFGGGVAFHGDFSPSWSGVARLGVAQVKAKITATVVGLGSASDSDTNTALYGGLGVGYRLSKTVSIDGAWDFTKSKYKKNGLDESWNVNAVSVGVTFGF
jgi:OmpA-OmpF porin, OOP family